MTQYIDKSAVVAEIEKRLEYYKQKHNEVDKLDMCYYGGLMAEDKSLLSFLDTLEVKDVQDEPISEDLEEASDELKSLRSIKH